MFLLMAHFKIIERPNDGVGVPQTGGIGACTDN